MTLRVSADAGLFSEEGPDFNFTAEIAAADSMFLRNVGIDART